MNIFGKTLIPIFLAAIMLASCNSFQPTPSLSSEEIRGTHISTVSTGLAETQRGMPTATANAPTESVPAALLTRTARPTVTDLPTSTPFPTYTPLPELLPNAIDLQWITAYKLPGDESITTIHSTRDGGFILLGSGVLLKLRADGLIEWQKSLSYVAALVTAMDVLETSAGDFILAGDLDWIKFDSQGNLLWQHTFEGPSYHTGPIHRLVEERNGNIVVEAAGSRTVFNADGELQSFTEADSHMSPKEVIDRFRLDNVWFVQATADGGALVGTVVYEDLGDVASWSSHLVISRISADGSVRWQGIECCYFGAGYEDFHAFETKSGDTIVAGTVHYFAASEGRNHVLIFSLDSDGEHLWERVYATEGHAPEEQDAVTIIQELSNGDLLFAGQTSRAGIHGQNIWVLKTNAQGEIPNCDLMFDGSTGMFGDFPPPDVEASPLEDEQRPFGNVVDAQAIRLCPPSSSQAPKTASPVPPSTEEATLSSTLAPETLTPGSLTCQLTVNQNIHVLEGTNLWSQPDVVNGSLISTQPAGTSVYVISAPAWGRIVETGASGWWWEISSESNSASMGWIWEGRIEECH